MENKKRKSVVCTAQNRADALYSLSAKRVEAKEFWRWGADNNMPEALATLSRRSTAHRRILNDKADYISGKGFNYDATKPLLGEVVDRVNGEGESLRQVLNKLAFDKMLFGNAFLEVITDESHSFLSLYHHDATHCRVAKDSQHIILHHDWHNFRVAEAKTLPLYPLFEQQSDGTVRSMIHYKDYEPMFLHYGVPQYIAGMNVSAIAYKTDRWNIARLDNSFQLSGVMMIDNAVDSESEASELARIAEQRFAGKPGQVMFIIRNESSDDNSRFIPIESQNDGDWRDLHDQATSDIVVAHSWFRSLSGLEFFLLS